MTEYVTLEEIELAYLDCRRNKRNTYGALEYELNYELNNYQLWKELNEKSYEIGQSICFCVTRPKLREVFCAKFRDRIVHHVIMLKFLHLFDGEMIADSYNCRKGKGVVYAVNRMQSHIESVSDNYTHEAYVLKCDMQGFFMSINRDTLWQMIESLVRNRYHNDDIEWWLWLIHKVIYNRPEVNCEKRGDLELFNKLEPHKSLFHTNGKGLPIGNLTSQIFANYYLTLFDKWMLSMLDENERYGRFVDDFVIVSRDKQKLLRMIDLSRRWLDANLGVMLHPSKVYLQEVKKGVEFVGTIIKPQRRYTTNRTVKNAFAVINDYNEGKENLQRFVCRMNSYMGFLVQSNSYAIRWKLWEGIKNKRGICCVNMRKLEIINESTKYIQTEKDGVLIGEWIKINNENELHQDNNQQGSVH